MPALRDPRRERFAQAMVKGKSAKEAYRIAGYSERAINGSHIVRRREDVSRRIAELTAQTLDRERRSLERAQQKYDVTSDRVIGELARIGFANIQDYIRIDSDGAPRYDLARMTRDQAAAIAEIIVDEYKDGKGVNARDVKRVRIKLADKRAALVDLGRHLGLFVDPSVVNLNVANFFSEAPPSMAEWRHEIEAQALEHQTTGAVTGAPVATPEKRRKSKR